LVIIIFSLYFCYFRYTSPAFAIDYGKAIKGTIKENDLSNIFETHRVGWLIELGRALLYTIFYIYMLNFVYKFRGFPTNALSWLIVILIGLSVTVVLLWYHLKMAPEELSKKSKYWKYVKNDATYWNINKYWENFFKNKNMTKNIDTKGTKEYYLMYQRPYRYYFIYSFVIYVLMLIPIFWVSITETRKDYIINTTNLLLSEKVIQEEKDTATCEQLLQHIGKAYFSIKSSIQDYSWLALFIIMAALYESIFGYLTLAKAAKIFAIVGFVSIMFGIFILFPNFITYESVFNKVEEMNHLLNCERSISQYSSVSLILNLKNCSLAISLIALILASFYKFKGK
jgi:hypothetical protein